tara:strand:+ start:5042 stop:5716 length:675 start_codon:yes stop_codon:yes gene_type:complete
MPTLILMAKAPWSGMAKTRLVPPYSRHQAAEIAGILLRLSVDICARHWAGELVIAGWPNTDHRIFSELEKQYQVTLASQSKGDLGEKMQCLLDTAFERNKAAAVMGTDVPHIPSSTLVETYNVLSGGGSVVGPTQDGGFCLLGLSYPVTGLFTGIDWGSSDVYEQMLLNARASGLTFDSTFASLTDIDCATGLHRVASRWSPLHRALTAAGVGLAAGGGVSHRS